MFSDLFFQVIEVEPCEHIESRLCLRGMRFLAVNALNWHASKASDIVNLLGKFMSLYHKESFCRYRPQDSLIVFCPIRKIAVKCVESVLLQLFFRLWMREFVRAKTECTEASPIRRCIDD